MLSKNCSAVKGYLHACELRKDKKQNSGKYIIQPDQKPESRKESYARQASKDWEKKQEEMRKARKNQ